MTFLALQPVQVVWLVAATAGAVLALFFLKVRRRPLFVSSLLLWQRLLDEQRASSLLERLRRLISLLLALAIALSIALALARPSGAEAARPLVLVVDTAPSLLARTNDGRTRWDHAIEHARSLVRAHAGSARFMIADTGGAAAREARTMAEALTLLDGLRPGAFEGLPAVDLAGAAGAYLITDGVRLAGAPDGMDLVSVFERGPNVSITSFEIASSPDSPRNTATIEIANDADVTTRVTLHIEGRGAPPITRTIDMPAGTRHRDRFTLDGLAAGAVRATIQSHGDALAADDAAVAYLTRSGPIRVLLVSRGHEILRSVFAADRRVRFAEVTPDALGDRTLADVDVYVFDRDVPARLPAAAALIVGPSEQAWKGPLSAFGRASGSVSSPGVTVAVDHPATRAVSWTDVRIDRAVKVALAGGSAATPVARAGDVPLVLAVEGERRLIVTFDVRESDFPFQPAFPIFMRNALEWLAGDAPAEARAAGTVEVAGQDVRVTTLDGTVVPTRRAMGTSVFDARSPEVFAVDADGRHQYLVVGVADPASSRINASSLPARTARSAPAAGLAPEWWRSLLVLAVVLATLEWWTYHRRITV